MSGEKGNMWNGSLISHYASPVCIESNGWNWVVNGISLLCMLFMWVRAAQQCTMHYSLWWIVKTVGRAKKNLQHIIESFIELARTTEEKKTMSFIVICVRPGKRKKKLTKTESYKNEEEKK